MISKKGESSRKDDGFKKKFWRNKKERVHIITWDSNSSGLSKSSKLDSELEDYHMAQKDSVDNNTKKDEVIIDSFFKSN